MDPEHWYFDFSTSTEIVQEARPRNVHVRTLVHTFEFMQKHFRLNEPAKSERNRDGPCGPGYSL